MKNKNGDLTVQEASERLGVTPRSIINYINAKEIEAVKVGKSWFIRRASLDSFSIRFGIGRSVSSSPPTKEKVEANFPNDSENAEKEESSGKSFSVKNLRLFAKAKDILGALEFDQSEGNANLKERLEDLKLSAIELLGAGYYSFEPKNKKNLYNESRQKVGAILALSYFNLTDCEASLKLVREIEDDLLPAYSALIKRMDRRNEKHKSI